MSRADLVIGADLIIFIFNQMYWLAYGGPVVHHTTKFKKQIKPQRNGNAPNH